jgi:hypothetical protein
MKIIHWAPVTTDRGTVDVAKVVKLEDLRVPIHVALGRLEAASDQELNDLIIDCTHELTRR